MQNGILNITGCDVGFTIDGTNYTFEHVDLVTIEDPQKAHLMRGVNNTTGAGLKYREGIGSPYIATAKLRSVGITFEALLKSNFESEDTLDFWIIDRATGTNKFFKQAVLQNAPKQLNISEGEDSFDIEVVIESFDYQPNYKA